MYFKRSLQSQGFWRDHFHFEEQFGVGITSGTVQMGELIRLTHS